MIRLALALSALASLVLIGCGRQSVSGEWEVVNPETGLALGDTMTLSDDGTWSKTGFPPMSGTYSWVSGNLALHIDTVMDMTREDAIKDGGNKLDVAAQLKEMDRQFVFALATEDGQTTLKQVESVSGRADIWFRKKDGS